MKKLSKEEKYLEDQYKKVKAQCDAMFEPSKEDIKLSRETKELEEEIRQLQKEGASLQRENAKFLKNALRENGQQAKSVEKILKNDPTNKAAVKALQELKKNRNSFEKLLDENY